MSSPREAQLPLLLSISEGLSRGTDEMLRVSPQGDAIHPPSCSLAIRESVEEIKWLRAEVERLRAALRWYADLSNHLPVECRDPGDPDPAVVVLDEPPILRDNGTLARAALEAKP